MTLSLVLELSRKVDDLTWIVAVLADEQEKTRAELGLLAERL